MHQSFEIVFRNALYRRANHGFGGVSSFHSHSTKSHSSIIKSSTSVRIWQQHNLHEGIRHSRQHVVGQKIPQDDCTWDERLPSIPPLTPSRSPSCTDFTTLPPRDSTRHTLRKLPGYSFWIAFPHLLLCFSARFHHLLHRFETLVFCDSGWFIVETPIHSSNESMSFCWLVASIVWSIGCIFFNQLENFLHSSK